ncbi:hypothetical protein [Caballeronia sp.]|jgi:hypothetical protein|uniref:hypothetical protein n=1 Tax=Caballeronia sp. TaxID=1931223 RepID=UPI003C57F837
MPYTAHHEHRAFQFRLDRLMDNLSRTLLNQLVKATDLRCRFTGVRFLRNHLL